MSILNINEKIKQLRVQQGMPQQELAEHVGFKTASAINKIELGKRDINQSKIILFANALNTTPAYLMGCDDEKADSSIDNNFLHLFKALNNEQKSAVMEIVKQLSNNLNEG